MDYLSFAGNNPQSHLLNSISNLWKAGGILAVLPKSMCFCSMTSRTCEHLQARFGERLSDKSIHIVSKVNDYLCSPCPQSGRVMKQEEQVNHQRRMMQPPEKARLKDVGVRQLAAVRMLQAENTTTQQWFPGITTTLVSKQSAADSPK